MECGPGGCGGGGGGACGGGAGDAPQPQPQPRPRPQRRCYKCKRHGVAAAVRQREALCAPCVRVCAEQRFRASLGRNGMLRDGMVVALALSGGACSRAALSLLQAVRQVRRAKAAPYGAR